MTAPVVNFKHPLGTHSFSRRQFRECQSTPIFSSCLISPAIIWPRFVYILLYNTTARAGGHNHDQSIVEFYLSSVFSRFSIREVPLN